MQDSNALQLRENRLIWVRGYKFYIFIFYICACIKKLWLQPVITFIISLLL